MSKLILVLAIMCSVAVAAAQGVPVTPGNPNVSPQNPNITPINPNIGVTGTTGINRAPDYPSEPYNTGATGYTGPTNIGTPGLSGELNDERNRNIDFNRQKMGITGPSGPTGKSGNRIYK